MSEIQRVGQTAQFNGIYLFTGRRTTITFQIGANDGETISVSTAHDVVAGRARRSRSGPVRLATRRCRRSTGSSTRCRRRPPTSARSRTASATRSNNLSTYSGEPDRRAVADPGRRHGVRDDRSSPSDQILEQAGISMLSQAEQNPQPILKLLGWLIHLSPDPGGAPAPPGQASQARPRARVQPAAGITHVPPFPSGGATYTTSDSSREPERGGAALQPAPAVLKSAVAAAADHEVDGFPRLGSPSGSRPTTATPTSRRRSTAACSRTIDGARGAGRASTARPTRAIDEVLARLRRRAAAAGRPPRAQPGHRRRLQHVRLRRAAAS